MPQFGQSRSDVVQGLEHIGGDGEHGSRMLVPRELRFGFSQLSDRRFPAWLQFGGDEAVLRIDVLILTLRPARRVAQALHLLPSRRESGRAARVGVIKDLYRDVDGRGRERFEELSRHLIVDRRGRQPLTNGFAVLKHPITVTQRKALFPTILRSSLSGRHQGHWNDAASDAGIAWGIIQAILREKKVFEV